MLSGSKLSWFIKVEAISSHYFDIVERCIKVSSTCDVLR